MGIIADEVVIVLSEPQGIRATCAVGTVSYAGRVSFRGSFVAGVSDSDSFALAVFNGEST